MSPVPVHVQLAEQGVPPPPQAALGEMLAQVDRAGAVGDSDGQAIAVLA